MTVARASLRGDRTFTSIPASDIVAGDVLAQRASMHWLGRIAQRDPSLFVLWQLGVKPDAGE